MYLNPNSFINMGDTFLYIKLENTNIIETNITSKIQLQTYANKTHISCSSSNNINASMIKGRYVEFILTTDKIIINNPLCKINSVFDKVYWSKVNNRYEVDRNIHKASQTDLNDFTLDLNNDKIIFNTLKYLSPLRYMSNILLYEDNSKIAIKPSDYNLSTEVQVREFLLNKYIYVVGNKTTEIINGINTPLRLYQRMETYFNTNNQLIKPSYIGIGIKNLP